MFHILSFGNESPVQRTFKHNSCHLKSIYHRTHGIGHHMLLQNLTCFQIIALSDKIWNQIKLFETLQNVLKFWAWCGMWEKSQVAFCHPWHVFNLAGDLSTLSLSHSIHRNLPFFTYFFVIQDFGLATDQFEKRIGFFHVKAICSRRYFIGSSKMDQEYLKFLYLYFYFY